MGDRSLILEAIRRNIPPAYHLSPIPDQGWTTYEDPLDHFKHIVEEIGGVAVDIDRAGIGAAINERFPDAVHTASRVAEFTGSVDLEEVEDPKALELLDVFVCEGVLGVAENGAIWVPERSVVHRVAPFITQHLVLVLDKITIVSNMHEAYARVGKSRTGFGVFIAGPSKTADIEQSLVLGAHGPRSLTVLLV